MAGVYFHGWRTPPHLLTPVTNQTQPSRWTAGAAAFPDATDTDAPRRRPAWPEPVVDGPSRTPGAGGKTRVKRSFRRSRADGGEAAGGRTSIINL